MARTSRKSDPKILISRLEHKYHVLKDQVAELDRHLFLTPAEQLRINELKKQKLATKDALRDLRTR